MRDRLDAERDFEEFVVACWPRLCRAAYLLTGDRSDAEDLAQTALARTYAAWSRVRRADAFAYVRKVMVNANVDRHRRRRLVEQPHDDSRPGSDPGAHDAGLAAADDRDEVISLLDRLTARERAVVVLRFYCDASESEVADQLGIRPGTVKSTSARALAKLRVDDGAGVRETIGDRRVGE
jgi:RNA polymerase sigma-70 factor (sigma-E family)